ncbi:MAG TPA: DUF3303 family protein [Actinomycetota bacterium]|nr:DUF3303 family protein [Actinomycetota bacterium]
MLHMIVNTHNPESCAFRGEEEDRLLTAGIDQFRKSSPDNGVTFQGWWINRAAHEFFILVDAASSHVIEEALLKTGLVGRTHSRILPVVSVDEA